MKEPEYEEIVQAVVANSTGCREIRFPQEYDYLDDEFKAEIVVDAYNRLNQCLECAGLYEQSDMVYNFYVGHEVCYFCDTEINEAEEEEDED